MNKWIKQGMTGLVVGTSVFASAIAASQVNPKGSSEVSVDSQISIDAIDYAGGSKLKDRNVVETASTNEIYIVRAIQA